MVIQEGGIIYQVIIIVSIRRYNNIIMIINCYYVVTDIFIDASKLGQNMCIFLERAIEKVFLFTGEMFISIVLFLEGFDG